MCGIKNKSWESTFSPWSDAELWEALYPSVIFHIILKDFVDFPKPRSAARVFPTGCPPHYGRGRRASVQIGHGQELAWGKTASDLDMQTPFLTIAKKWKHIPGNENPESIFTKPENRKKCYHEWQTYFLSVLGRKAFPDFWLCWFYFTISRHTIKMITFEKVLFSLYRALGKVTFLKVLIFNIAPSEKAIFTK